jgi:phage gpG-like protein
VVAAHGGDVKTALTSAVNPDAAKAHIPARPFVMIQPKDAEAIQRVFDEWIAERAALAGFRNV